MNLLIFYPHTQAGEQRRSGNCRPYQVPFGLQVGNSYAPEGLCRARTSQDGVGWIPSHGSPSIGLSFLSRP